MKKLMVLALWFSGTMAWPQASGALHKGAWEVGLWVGGGTGLTGSTSDTRFLNAGVRLGKVLTGQHGAGWLRGNFEYAVDAIPLYVVFQQNTVYGASFSPFLLKWNFTGARKVAPYVELGEGVLFTADDVPRGTNPVNFASQAAVGVQVFTREKRALTLAARYAHISNAGLATPNPGINTLQFTLGYSWFK